jgi:hypothetical protein
VNRLSGAELVCVFGLTAEFELRRKDAHPSPLVASQLSWLLDFEMTSG